MDLWLQRPSGQSTRSRASALPEGKQVLLLHCVFFGVQSIHTCYQLRHPIGAGAVGKQTCLNGSVVTRRELVTLTPKQ